MDKHWLEALPLAAQLIPPFSPLPALPRGGCCNPISRCLGLISSPLGRRAVRGCLSPKQTAASLLQLYFRMEHIPQPPPRSSQLLAWGLIFDPV